CHRGLRKVPRSPGRYLSTDNSFGSTLFAFTPGTDGETRQPMRDEVRGSVSVGVAALIVWMLPGVDTVAAQEYAPDLCFEQLAKMSWPDLEPLYRHAPPANVPPGYLRGKAVYCQDSRLAGPRAAVTNFLWHGKHFRDDCTLINQWCGVKAIKAKVYPGDS